MVIEVMLQDNLKENPGTDEKGIKPIVNKNYSLQESYHEKSELDEWDEWFKYHDPLDI